jgi:hypothetical protein
MEEARCLIGFLGRCGVGNQCPTCGKDDQVIKVSAIVSGGTMINLGRGPGFGVSPSLSSEGWSISGSLTGGQPKGMSYSGLAQKLMLVQEDEGKWSDPIWLVVTLALGVGSAVLAIDALGKREESPSIVWLSLFMGVWSIAFFIGASGAASSMSGKKKAKLANQRRRAVWDTLYYCYRDDAVYAPGAGRSVPADQMYEVQLKGSWPSG